MARVAPVIPEESVLVCEGCGYILSGLPGEGRCPECGKPIAESSPQLRRLPAWELDEPGHSLYGRFWGTTVSVIRRPGEFYRTLATRVESGRAAAFARIHGLAVSLLVGLTATLQLAWVLGADTTDLQSPAVVWLGMACVVLGSALSYLALAATTRLAARLTAWEAAFRGFRLPRQVVLRGLYYHTAHYLPVAMIAFVTVVGYQLLLTLELLTGLSAPGYLYVLCGEVVVAAGYLFVTYWKAMRNMLFANG